MSSEAEIARCDVSLTLGLAAANNGRVSRRPPRRFDPTQGPREELRLAREDLGRARAVAVLLEERIARLEAWLADAGHHGLDGSKPPVLALPLARTHEFEDAPGGLQWNWTRYVLLQADAPMALSVIADRILQEGGPAIAPTSLGSLLRKRQVAGDVEHVGRAWCLKR